jgi:hypothetical protein
MASLFTFGGISGRREIEERSKTNAFCHGRWRFSAKRRLISFSGLQLHMWRIDNSGVLFLCFEL